MTECVFHDVETGESRPVLSTPRRGRPTAQVPAHLLSVTQSWQQDGSLVLTAKGRLDLNTVLSFRDAVFSALGERPPHLTLDLSPLQFVEATGIATLVTLVRVAQMVQVPCRILPSSDLRELFQETGLDRVVGEPAPSGEMIAQKLLFS